MAVATIVGTTTKTVSGGTSSDRLTLTDIVTAIGSGFTAPIPNTGYQTSAGALLLQLANNTFSNLTGGELVFDNASNGQNASLRIDGDVTIGGVNDYRPFTVRYGEKSLTGGYSSQELISANAVLSMPDQRNRIILQGYTDQPSSAFPNEPGARSIIGLTNNVAGNELRISILGAPQSDDSNYTLPSPTGFKPNGTFILSWQVGSDVTVRDLEFRDGYVDWRPTGDWEAPTRGVFISKTWMKFLGAKAFTDAVPLLLGSADDEFNVVVGEDGQAGSYILHGLYPSGAVGRIVYLNYSGLDWDSQMALYSRGKLVKVENHLVLDYSVINAVAQPIDDAKIIVYKKDPVYPANGQVDYTSAETTVKVNTDATGKGNIGSDTGNGDFICVEAFTKTGNGGNVDGAYANSSHSTAEYASNDAVFYSVFKFGKQIIYRVPIDLAKAGEFGEGKQSLGVLQLNDDLTIVASDISSVSTTIIDAETFQDNSHKYCIENEIDTLTSRESSTINAGDYDVVVTDSGDAFAFDGTTITINSNSFNGSIKTTGIVTDAADVVNGSISDSSGDSLINVTTPAGYDNEITVYANLSDAEGKVNILKTSASIRYQSAVFGGQVLFFRTEQADGTPAIGSQLIPIEAGVYSVNVATTSEGAALGEILAISKKFDAMISVDNGDQVFKTEALQNSVTMHKPSIKAG